MQFCSICENMYYIKLSEINEKALEYYCRNCGNETNIPDSSTIVISSFKPNQTAENDDYSHIINKYTKLDPTLPRIYTIPCPNAECPTNHEQTPTPVDILYIKYDTTNVKYLYMCTTCDHVWKETK